MNLLGGNIKRLESYGESNVNISGDVSIYAGPGYSGVGRFYDSTTITISSNDFSVDGLEFYHCSMLNMLTGTIIHCLDSYNTSSLNIYGGNINQLRLWGESTTTNISDGTISELIFFEGKNTVNMSGGNLSKILADSDRIYSFMLNIIGYSLSAIPYGGDYSYGQINGTWNNDVSFSISLDGEVIYSKITLYDGVIPANCINKPESDLSGDCKVNFIDFSKIADEWLFDGTE